jgi:phosphoribosylanthranilate isomerase
VTRLEDARRAAELGAWAIGLVFHAESPRACEPAAAEEIGTAMKRAVEVAGVFVNAPLDEVAREAERCELTLLQLHGDEGPAYCREAARRTGCRVIKAARVRDAHSIVALRPYDVDFHLLDAHRRGRPGGTGETFDWELAAGHDRRVPVLLSGGLTPDNVAEAIAVTSPFAVDVASGTESRAGVKDPAKLEAFFGAVKGAAAAAGASASR